MVAHRPGSVALTKLARIDRGLTGPTQRLERGRDVGGRVPVGTGRLHLAAERPSVLIRHSVPRILAHPLTQTVHHTATGQLRHGHQNTPDVAAMVAD